MSQPSTSRRSEILIAVRQPFDLAKTLRFILSPPQLRNGRKFDPLLDHFEDGEYRRVAEVGGVPVLYGVAEIQNRGRSHLRVRIVEGPADNRTLQEIADIAERQFSAGLDVSAFYDLARRDPAAARRTLEPLRLPYVSSAVRAHAEELLKTIGRPDAPGR